MPPGRSLKAEGGHARSPGEIACDQETEGLSPCHSALRRYYHDRLFIRNAGPKRMLTCLCSAPADRASSSDCSSAGDLRWSRGARRIRHLHIAAQRADIYSEIARVSSALDPQSRTMMVELDAYNKDGTLAPGMYPTVDWPTSSAEPLLLVPSTSVVSTRHAPS